jgi:hypothetical protein
MSQKMNLIGHVYGRLTVIAEANKNGRSTMWLCRCKCGNEKAIAAGSLRNGVSKSCGCLHKESSAANGRRSTIHGMKNTPTYESWRAMRKRCFSKYDQAYARYGGAGITVCDSWKNSFAAFLSDMGERPEGTSIDRIDPFGNYEPSNCRWADRKTQSRNKKNTKKVYFLGRYYAVIDIAERTGFNYSTICKRLSKGDSIESALRY